MKKYEEQVDSEEQIDFARHLYPYCVVWTPIPVVSYVCPWVGHTGVGASDGKIHDFSASRTVTVDSMLFGWPKKYVKVELDADAKAKWDQTLQVVDARYAEKVHNLVQNNCHSHVADLLTEVKFESRTWSTVSLWWLTITRSQYVSTSAVVVTYLPFLLLLLLLYVLSP